MEPVYRFILKLSALGLSLLLIQTEVVCLAEAVAPLKSASDSAGFDQAETTIRNAEKRNSFKFDAPADAADFEALVRANATIHFIDDPGEFLVWWQQNKVDLIAQTSSMGPGLNWQTFIANIYIKYKITKTDAHKDPSAFLQWMTGVLSNPWVKRITSSTFGVVATGFAFITGIVYGAMVAGPAAGFINAFLEPLIRPIREKGSVVGTKLFGRGGKALNSLLFDRKAKVEVTTGLEDAKTTIKDVRSILTIANYRMSAQQWSENMKRVYASWNHLNFVWNKMPDVYHAGRDRAMDMIVFRPKDFANSVTQAMSAAEVHRQGAEQMLDRIMLKSSDPRQVESIGRNLLSLIEEQMRLQRETEKSEALQPRIIELQNKLVELGAAPDQASRVVENFRRVFVFTRQAAGVLAANLLHDAQFSDMIAETRATFEALRDSYSLEFFHAELGSEVSEILERMEFQINVDLKTVSEIEVKEGSARPALELVEKLGASTDGARAASEPGSLTRPAPVTGEQRVQEAVGRAGKR
ncbi:MAG: hypothetical protein ACXVA9_11555 [Bdellovibrionales bacterium]